MKIPFGVTAILVLLLAAVSPAVMAKEMVINGCFEYQDLTDHWEWDHSIMIKFDCGVKMWDVTGSGEQSWAFKTKPKGMIEDISATMKQQVFVIQGEKYEVSMDICFHCC